MLSALTFFVTVRARMDMVARNKQGCAGGAMRREESGPALLCTVYPSLSCAINLRLAAPANTLSELAGSDA